MRIFRYYANNEKDYSFFDKCIMYVKKKNKKKQEAYGYVEAIDETEATQIAIRTIKKFYKGLRLKKIWEVDKYE